MRLERLGRGLGAAALVVAALTLGRAIGAVQTYDYTVEQPYRVPGAAGEPVTLRTGDLTVQEVRLARSAEGAFRSYRSEEGALFVMVDYTFTPRERSGTVAWAQLEDPRGRVYSPDPRGDLSCAPAPPDLTMTCQVLLEAPEDAFVGAALALSPHGGDQRYDSMAVVELGITARQVARARAATDADPLVLDYPSLVDPDAGDAEPGADDEAATTGDDR